MLIRDAIQEATVLTGQTVEEAVSLRWLSELDGQIAFDVYGADAWAPYGEEDTDAELLAPYPYDGRIYLPYLEAMTYYSDGEYDRYENARAMHEAGLLEFRKFLQRTHAPLCCR